MANARTDSTLLNDLIDQHPQALAAGELFNSDPRSRPLVAGERFADDQDGAAFIERFYRIAESCSAVGFKLHHGDCRSSGSAARTWDYLASHLEIQVLHTVRDDPLARLVSIRQAGITGWWYAPQGTDPPQADPFPLAVESVRLFFQQQQVLAEQTVPLFDDHPRLEVEYGAFTGNLPASIKPVYDFLGLPKFTPSVHLVKQGRRPLAEQIANFAELVVAFRGTEWGDYLERHLPAS